MYLDRTHQYLRVGERYYTPDTLPTSEPANQDAALVNFLRTWWSDDEYMLVQTSGSTGAPKLLRVSKARMMQSARATCSFFELNASDTALLCMDLRYIGAMMLVVRCLISGMKLIVQPTRSNPLLKLEEEITFAAIVPLQAREILRDPTTKNKLSRIKYTIIGGSSLDAELEHELSTLPNGIYSTYGMTETLSHIALRRVSGTDTNPYYTPLEGISVYLSDRGTLCIKAPLITPEPLETNDLAELLSDGRFRILGRSDNIINSGGVKIQLELVEEAIAQLHTAPLALTWRRDQRLGQALILVLEERGGQDKTQLLGSLKSHLPCYHCPKDIIYVPEIPRLANGKLNRKALERIANVEKY